jgi:capsular exopolysaccharide synthesis family protein
MAISNVVTINNPKSPVSEAYRTLRTNLQFSSLDHKLQTLVVTSSGPSEGKTTTASNLAVAMAQGGGKTILIDCDQRKPKLHKMFGLSNMTGLSNLLIGETSLEGALQETEVENLYILPAGTRPPNPAELLGSSRMESFMKDLKKEFDNIILDTPPVIMVTDAQILTKYADGSVLVVASGEADREAAARAKELLEKVGSRILGVVLNKLDTTRKGYYSHYYQYYYGNDADKKGKKKFSLKRLFKKKKKY